MCLIGYVPHFGMCLIGYVPPLGVSLIGYEMLTRSIDYIGDKPNHRCSRCGIIKRYDHIAIRDPCVCKVCAGGKQKPKSMMATL